MAVTQADSFEFRLRLILGRYRDPDERVRQRPGRPGRGLLGQQY